MTDHTIEATILSMLVRGACLSALAIAIGALLYGRCSAHTLTMLWRGTLAALYLLPLFSTLSPPIPILPARGGLPVEQAISVKGLGCPAPGRFDPVGDRGTASQASKIALSAAYFEPAIAVSHAETAPKRNFSYSRFPVESQLLRSFWRGL